MSGISQISLNQRIQGSTPFIEIQSLEPTQLQINNSKLGLSEDVNVVGNLIVQGTINSASVSNSAIEVPSLVGTTSLTTPKIIFPDNQTAGLVIQASDNADYITLKSSDGAEQIQLNKTIYTAGNSLIHGTNSSRGTIQYANIVNSTIAPSNTINANSATATLLQTARDIGGVSFNGSSSINLPGVNEAGNQNTSGTASAWTSSRTTNFTSLAGDALGSVSLSGTGDTTAQLKTPFYDESNSSAKKLILSNTTSGHTSASLQQRIDFENEFLPGMNQSANLVGKLSMAKDVFSITQYNTGVSNTSQATTFTRGSDTFPKMNSMLRFLQSSAGANISVERDGTYDGNSDQRALPSGIDFKLGSGTYIGGNLGGLQGGIRSNYTSTEVGNTKVFASYVSGTVKEASLLLKPDELSLTNMGIIKFNGAGTISSSDSNITLTPASGKQVVLGTKVRVGSVAETADEEDNPYLFGIEDPTPINSSSTDVVSQLLSFKYHINNGSYNRHFGIEGDQANGGIQLVKNVFGNTANDGYTGTRTKTKLIQFNGNGFCSINDAPLTDGLHITQPSSGTCLGFSHPDDTAKRWTWLVGSNFDLTLGGNTGCNNLTLNGTARASLQALGGIAGVYGSTDVEITATSGDVKLVSGDDTFITAGGDTIIGDENGSGSLYIQERSNSYIMRRDTTTSTTDWMGILKGFYPGTTTQGFVMFLNGDREADGGAYVLNFYNTLAGIKYGSTTHENNYRAKVHTFTMANHTTSVVGALRYFRYANGTSWASTTAGSGNTDKINIHLETGGLWLQENGALILVSSDERLKDEIEIVNDDEALVQVRNLEVKKYHYKDKTKRREHKSIGFIAQDVMKICPNAVSLKSGFIPDEMREVEDLKWVGNDLYLDLPMKPEDTGVVSFYVVDKYDPDNIDIEEGELGEGDRQHEKKIKVQYTLEGDAYYTFEKQYDTVFVYGREITNFHTIDKQQLFALNFSATQELDRKAQAQDEKILSLEQKVEALTKVIEDLSKTVKINENALKNMI